MVIKALLADVESEPVPTTVKSTVIFNILLFHRQIPPVELHLILVPLEAVQILGLVRVSEHFTLSDLDQITLKGH
jgi:hypothetical protein